MHKAKKTAEKGDMRVFIGTAFGQQVSLCSNMSFEINSSCDALFLSFRLRERAGQSTVIQISPTRLTHAHRMRIIQVRDEDTN